MMLHWSVMLPGIAALDTPCALIDRPARKIIERLGVLYRPAISSSRAEAFTVLKLVGAVYLIWLGVKTWHEAHIAEPLSIEITGAGRAFREGILVEALNPKTAAFFPASIPQFVDPAANVAQQFIVLGLLSVTLNAAADVVVAYGAAKARDGLTRRLTVFTKLRQASAAVYAHLAQGCSSRTTLPEHTAAMTARFRRSTLGR